jgi:hypothetical protein
VPNQAQRIDPDLPVDVNITGLSNHVLAYKMWFRTAATMPWQELGSGHTGDNVPDHLLLHIPADRPGQLYYWVGVGNPQAPNSAYNGLLTLGQGGMRLVGGSILLNGRTDEKGFDVKEDWSDIL